jgi:predicted Zn finger-like uncharacterized protein
MLADAGGEPVTPCADMKLAEGIRKLGFRKWYERQLLQSHAHMALSFCCGIGIFAALEAASRFRSWVDQLTDLVALLVCTAVGLWALRRYLYLLTHAEAVAHQAECPVCKTYGRIELLQAAASGDEVQVRCRHCSHVWQILG